MKKYVFQILFLILCSKAILAQELIKGRVIDAQTNEILPFATVFVVGSSIGTSTNERGEFSFQVPFGTIKIGASFIGYAPISATFETKQLHAKTLTFKLEPISKELLEVKIEAKRSKKWLRDFKTFKREFLGVNPNNDDYEIENKDAIRLNWEDNTLKASCVEPIIILNKKLGYKVISMLQEFSYQSNGDMFYLGITRFEAMKAENEKEQSLWDKNRRDAYLGSPNHFFKSLINHQVAKNQFQVIKDTTISFSTNNFYDKQSNPNYQINLDKMVEADSANHQFILHLNKTIEVVYLGKFNDFPNFRYRNMPYEYTKIEPTTQEIKHLSIQGELITPHAIKFSGSMGNYRIGMALPSDYELEPQENPKK